MKFSEISVYSRVMLGTCAFLCVVIAAEALVLNADDGSVDNSIARSDDSPAAATGPLQIPPIAAYREAMQRPLFADTRRPPAVAPKAAGNLPAAQLNGKWKLTGVILAGENSTAYVTGVRDPNTIHLEAGTHLEGWRVEKIAADHVEFSSVGRTATLQLHEEEEDRQVVPIRRP